MCCSKEDKQQFGALLKPCLDISMWKGYEADNHSKNAAYYEGWYQCLLSAGATICDVLNKYQVIHAWLAEEILVFVTAARNKALCVHCRSIASRSITRMLYRCLAANAASLL